MLLIWLALSLIAGILLGSIIRVPLWLTLVLLVSLPLMCTFRKYALRILFVVLCLLTVMGGMLRFQSTQPENTPNEVQFYNGSREVILRGMVNGYPEEGDNTQQLQLHVTEIKSEQTWQPVFGKVLVFVAPGTEYHYGDFLMIIGELETPVSFADFDYPDYLAHQGIYATSYYPDIEIVRRGGGVKLLGWLYDFKNRLAHNLEMVLPEPQASLVKGILLGIRGAIPDYVSDSFIQSGTAHLLAISGLHLGIVALMTLAMALRLLGKRYYLYVWFVIAVVWCYALLTGLQAPVVRAVVMASIFLFAELLGRQRSAVTALVVAAAVMCLVDPELPWTGSFQMSFLAMAGIIFLAPLLAALFRKMIEPLFTGNENVQRNSSLVIAAFSISLGASITVWPLTAYHFSMMAPIGLLATLLTLPVMPLVIVGGMLVGLLGFIMMPLAYLAGWFVWLFASYLLAVVQFSAAHLPAITVTNLNPFYVWGFYAMLALLVWLARKRFFGGKLLLSSVSAFSEGTGSFPNGKGKLAFRVLLAIAALLVITAFTLPDEKLHVAFLDVGEGDAILISQGTQQVLIDGGPDDSALLGEMGCSMPFWDRTIELIILTHYDADHLSGLIAVLEKYNVQKIIYPGIEADSALYHCWQELLPEQEAEKLLAATGQKICLGNSEFSVLNPARPLIDGADNNDESVVLRLCKGDISFLFTGDISTTRELELLWGRKVSASTVLKVAHHGSAGASCTEFLSVVHPDVAVISVGEENSYGHPAETVLERLYAVMPKQNVYSTDSNGTVELITDGEQLWVATDR